MFRNTRRTVLALAIAALGTAGTLGFVSATSAGDNNKSTLLVRDEGRRTGRFHGPKANTGYAIETMENGRIKLSVSDDFEIPNTPAPSWQVIDSQGNTYLLNQFKIKGGTNRSI